jgi:hypothetical protein
MRQVRKELLKWRDEEISNRHRAWGFHCPCVDVDFLVLEFKSGKPCAIVEYKHKNVSYLDPESSSLQALVELGNAYGQGIPVFVAIYCDVDWWFKIVPLNKAAESIYTPERRLLSEKRFVKSLYYLRGSWLANEDSKWFSALSDVSPSEA